MKEKKQKNPIVGFWNWILLYFAITAIFLEHYYIATFLIIVFVAVVFYRLKNPDKRKVSSLSFWKKLVISILAFFATVVFAVITVPDTSDNRPKTSTNNSARVNKNKSKNRSAKVNKNRSKTNRKRSAKVNKSKNREKEMLRILNVWASVNNHYGKVKIDGNTPTLILNDETANLDKTKLSPIVTQFSNKVNAQKEMNKLKLGDPAVYDEEGTPIAVWTGSTLELTK